MSETTASAQAKESDKSAAKTKRGSKAATITDPSFNMKEVRDLAELFNEHGLTEFEFENENIRVRLSRMSTVQSSAANPVSNASTVTAKTETEHASPAPAQEEVLFQITSPIVGTFYRSPGPDKEPYVREGSKVGPDTVVCIVEAMKLMNEIQAETTGEVVKVYVENGQPVEYGQPLFGIRQ